MSEQVTRIGKIKKVAKGEEYINSHMIGVIKQQGLYEDYLAAPDVYGEELSDFFMDVFYEQYIVIGDTLYEIIDINEVGEDTYQITENGDDTYRFALSYYNGCCSFGEAIEQAFKNNTKEGK